MMQHRDQKWIVLTGLQIAAACLLAAVPGRSQSKSPPAENVFKNIQVLKGIPVDEFMDTMGFFSASLSLNCTSCHGLESAGDVAKFADDTPLKQTARKMILMVNAINTGNFGGNAHGDLLHLSSRRREPEVTPSLAEQYGAPRSEDPDKFEIPQQARRRLPPIEVFDKYIQALGGAQQLASLTSFIAKGTYEGYDTDGEKVPVEVFAKAPDQRTVVVHLPGGDKIRRYDGRDGWIAEPETPAPLMALTGGNLDGAKIDATLFFPLGMKEIRSQWRAARRPSMGTTLDVVEGTDADSSPR